MMEPEAVRKVAHLARLELSTAEETQFTHQLGDLLDYFAQLSALDVTDVEPTTRAIEVSNITRIDHLEPYGDRDTILASAPEPEGDFFRVPKIMAED
jgi:aspartyl-tRNA(Asn)/glutamyl-tRNA(Gln) amidotransferase subunit C